MVDFSLQSKRGFDIPLSGIRFIKGFANNFQIWAPHLLHHALGGRPEGGDGPVVPPLLQVSVLVELPTCSKGDKNI